MRAVRTKGRIPAISNSGKMMSTSQMIPKSMTKLKSPRVSNLKGKVIFLTIGLTKEVEIPKTNPAKRNISNGPLKLTPGKNLLVAHKTKRAIKLWKKIFFNTILKLTKKSRKVNEIKNPTLD